MELNSFGGSSDFDLLGRGKCKGGVVDCSLRLGLPGVAVAVGVDVDVEEDETGVTTSTCASLVCDAQRSVGSVVSELCTMCAATRTPLWRSGPYGPKSLCNACGIRYKKEERRLALTLGIPTPSSKSKSKHSRTKN